MNLGQFARNLAQLLPTRLTRGLRRPVALFFHGAEAVVEDSRVQVSTHSCEALYHFIKSVKTDFDVIPSSMLADAMEHPSTFRNAVFLTSDDGYANTATNVASIMRSLDVPWTLFVSTNHVVTGSRILTHLVRLFVFFVPAGSYLIPELGMIDIPISARGRQRKLHRIISATTYLELHQAERVVDAMLSHFPRGRLDELFDQFKSDKFLEWRDVKLLSESGVEIGSHGHWHWPMGKRETEMDFKEQAVISRDLIAKVTGNCRLFSYPYGGKSDISAKARNAICDAGYEYAFTSLTGFIDSNCDRWLLPRYSIRLNERSCRAMIPITTLRSRGFSSWQNEISFIASEGATK